MRKLIKRANDELFIASEMGNLEMVKKLIIESKSSCKPDINFKGPDFKTPLYAAVSEGHVGVVEFLLRSGARMDVRTLNERTPIHIACLRGHTDILKLLLKSSIELLNSIDSYGNTPAHYAAKYGNCKTLSYLLKFNPKLFLKNNKEKTPIDVAYDSEIIEIFGRYVNKIRKNLNQMTNKKSNDGIHSGLRVSSTKNVLSERKLNFGNQPNLFLNTNQSDLSLQMITHDTQDSKYLYSRADSMPSANFNQFTNRRTDDRFKDDTNYSKSPDKFTKGNQDVNSRPKSNMQFETYDGRKEPSNMTLKNQDEDIETGLFKLNTERARYIDKENISNFEQIYAKNNIRSRNSGKY